MSDFGSKYGSISHRWDATSVSLSWSLNNPVRVILKVQCRFPKSVLCAHLSLSKRYRRFLTFVTFKVTQGQRLWCTLTKMNIFVYRPNRRGAKSSCWGDLEMSLLRSCKIKFVEDSKNPISTSYVCFILTICLSRTVCLQSTIITHDRQVFNNTDLMGFPRSHKSVKMKQQYVTLKPKPRS